MTNYPIILTDINKEFYIGSATKDSALSRCLNFISGREQKKKITVLQNINLKIPNSKVIGLIGKNGSGKSTLLRIIADIYQPTSGKVSTQGHLVYLTGFNFGLMPKLTMKENIYLIGSLQGLKKKEISERIDEIISFSNLEKYVNTKVYQFSSGMVSRLTFSATIFCIKYKYPDILLIDEALDAGADINFRNRAIEKMEEIINGGATVLLISHNLETIEKYCKETIWLNNGGVFKEGITSEIIKEYIKENY
jgi:lipopolysaccharide transport system ATP-binding protein